MPMPAGVSIANSGGAGYGKPNPFISEGGFDANAKTNINLQNPANATDAATLDSLNTAIANLNTTLTAAIAASAATLNTSIANTTNIPFNRAGNPTSFTPALSDARYAGSLGTIITCYGSSTCTVTIPNNSTVAYPVGATLQFTQMGTGKLTFVGAGGVTINSPGNMMSTGMQYAAVTLVQIIANTWLIIGNVGS